MLVLGKILETVGSILVALVGLQALILEIFVGRRLMPRRLSFKGAPVRNTLTMWTGWESGSSKFTTSEDGNSACVRRSPLASAPCSLLSDARCIWPVF